ncbi:MAG: hypothetical protein Q8Q62_12855, partial [Mesorhizobium sp.]|nr:hypothetical protein [Mesorhizobium sp.]
MGVWKPMDWPEIVETHRQALKTVLAGLLALAACLGGRPTLPRHLHLRVMRLLRPAESAARRLIILAAIRLPMPEVAPPRVAKWVAPPPIPYGVRIVKVNLGLAVGPPPPKRLRARDASASPRPPAFQFLDPLRRVQLRRYPARASVPRILFPGYAEPFRVVKRRFD